MNIQQSHRIQTQDPLRRDNYEEQIHCICEKVWQKKGLGRLVPVMRATRASSSYHVNRISGRPVSCLHRDSRTSQGFLFLLELLLYGCGSEGTSQVVLVVQDPPASAADAGDLGSIPGWGRFPWRRAWQPTQIFLPGESHGQRSLVGHSPWGHKELDGTEATSCMHVRGSVESRLG